MAEGLAVEAISDELQACEAVPAGQQSDFGQHSVGHFSAGHFSVGHFSVSWQTPWVGGAESWPYAAGITADQANKMMGISLTIDAASMLASP